jgi:hypothetical protein
VDRVAAKPNASGLTLDLLSDLLDAAVAGDQTRVDQLLEQSRVELGVDDTVQRLLVPGTAGARRPVGDRPGPLEAFEVLLRVRGCSTRQLGANPEAALLSAVRATGAPAVVLTAHQTSRSRPAVEALTVLPEAADLVVRSLHAPGSAAPCW